MNDKEEIKNNNPFKVPENYFEEFPERIIIMKDQGPVKAGEKVIRLLKPHLILAAAMIGFVIISYSGLKLVFTDRSQEINNISSMEYPDQLLQEIDDYLIIMGLSSVDDYQFTQNLDNDEIAEYLLTEDLEYLTIIETL